MAKMTDEVLGHGADCDGIEEYDNALPDWWVGLFVITIIFAGIYPIYHHVLDGNLQAEAYEAEMAAAAKRWPVAEGPAELDMSAAAVAEGATIFEQTCASCHNANLTGGIGPSLVDAEWIHGGQPADVLKTISEGVAAKGMPAWGTILGPKKVQQVAAFVMSKQTMEPVPAKAAPEPAAGGTEGGAAPEGEGDAPAEGGDAAATADDGPPNGEAIFQEKCAVCHKPDLTGLVGPNLVDDEWIHGGELEQIKKTITEGVPDKGMVPWGPQLSEAQIDAVAQYVHGKANGK